MEASPPLLLLFDISQSQVRKKFDRLVAGSPTIAIDLMDQAEKHRTTLLFNGLTFLCDWNIAPGEAIVRRKIFSTIGDDSVRAAIGLSLHPHIAEGLRMPEIAKAFLALGASLASQLGAIAVVWQPAALQADTGYFVEVVASYADGGVFPVLPIVDFLFDASGGLLRSNGLQPFCGQEFELQAEQMDRQELIRRAIRLAHDLATNGAVEEAQEVADIDPDFCIQLLPSEDAGLLKCRIKRGAGQIVTLD